MKRSRIAATVSGWMRRRSDFESVEFFMSPS
jgi:hypothetical protein